MDTTRRLLVVVVIALVAVKLPVVTSDINRLCEPTGHVKCRCNGFGVYSSLYRAMCSQETGICNCNATLHVDGAHCDVCEEGFLNENGGTVPGNDGCPLAHMDAVTFDALSDPEPLVQDVGLDPNGERITATTRRLKRFTLDAPVGVVSSDRVRVSASYHNVSVRGLPKNAVAVGLLDMSAVSNDSESEFELFGRVFKENIKVEVEPEKTGEYDVVYPYLYDSRTNSLEAMGLAVGAENSTTIQFFTTSLSQVVFVSVPRTTLSRWMRSHSIDTGFTLQRNGWPSSTTFLWPTYNGMAIFARWFFVSKEKTLHIASKEWSTDLLDRMMTLLQVRCSDPPPQSESVSDLETFQVLIHALFVSHAPQLIWMEKSDYFRVLPGHAVLVYKYSMGEFSFYDPRFGSEQTLSFDLSTNKFDPYHNGGYNRFRVYSHTAFQLSDTDMETIYNQAVIAFNDSNAPDIVVDPFDANITTNSITVYGRVVPKPGQPLPAVVFSYVFSNDSERRAIARGRADVDSVGRFRKVLVDIVSQSSKIVFVAGGYVSSTNVPRTRRSDVPYRPPVASLYYRHGFYQEHITRTGKPNLLTVALTWDDGASDIDLHVLEPGERHIYYRNLGGSGTPFLDYDNTEGYGPEHYIVDSDFRASPSGTLEGTYKIRVHYYGDKGDINGRSIRWTLRIQGTTQDSTKVIRGVLRNDNVESASDFYSSDSSWSSTYEVTIAAVHFIAIADRRVDNLLGTAYHYSAQLWKNVLVLPDKRTEAKVSLLKEYNPTASKEGGVELLRESSSNGCSYKGWRLEDDCWKTKSVAISRIHYSERGTRYLPVYTHTDWNVVQAKWNKLINQAKIYMYAEQEKKQITRYPQSIYIIGFDVNNSNTFIRWLFASNGLAYSEMKKAHPGRDLPERVPTESFQGTVFCAGSPTVPPLTDGNACDR